jgi:hypothetical protein
MKRFLFVAVAWLIAVAPAQAQKALSPAAFYGVWTGSGVAENRDSVYFAVTQRDLDVTIKPAGNGFTVSWTTVIRKGGDPARPNVRQRETTLTLQPTARPRVWRAAESGDAIAGQPMAWARIVGQTLTVYRMTVQATGAFEIEQYDRTLTGTGMDLKFTLRRDREPVRTVNAKLIKTAP